MASEAQQNSEMVKLGRISGVFGVKGWLKVYSDTEPHDNILSYSPWYLRRRNDLGEWQRYEVKTGRVHGKGLVVHLEGCNDRDEAAALVGRTVAIRTEQLPAAGKDEYYWRDLIGLEVVTTAGESLGVVEQMLETGANDVLVVRTSETGNGKKVRERLIPYIREQVIREIDLQAGRLVVDWDPEF